MALTQVTGPYPIFTDLDGTPLDDGYLYIGDVNQDPEQNPIQVYWDANLTIAATQPIRTSNGYAYRNGTPALIYTAGQFSITIRNKREEFVIYSPVGYGFDPGAVSASVVKNDFVGDGIEVNFTLSAAPSTILATSVFINGVYQEKDNYSILGNTITFSIAPPLSSSIEVMTNETGIINTGYASDITYTAGFTGAVTQTVQTKLEQYVSVKDFGAVGDGVTDDTAAFKAAIATARTIYIPSGTYLTDFGDAAFFPNAINFIPSGTHFVGEGESTIWKPYTKTARGCVGTDSGSSSTFSEDIRFSNIKFEGYVVTDGLLQTAHLVYLSGVKRVLIEKCSFVGPRGDGLYIGSGFGGGPSYERHNFDVSVHDCFFDGVNNGNRNGISVIDVDGMTIEGCTFTRLSDPTMPGSIDFEPDDTYSVIKNVVIDSNKFELCTGSGGHVNVALGNIAYINFDRFIVSNNNFRNSNGVVIETKSTGGPSLPTTSMNIVIANNTFSTTQWPVSKGVGFVYGLTITGNSIFSSFSGGGYMKIGHPTLGGAWRTKHLVVSNNNITCNHTYGIDITDGVVDAVVSNNVIDGATSAAIRQGLATGSTTRLTVTGNVVVGTPTYVVDQQATTKNAATNTFSNNYAAPTVSNNFEAYKTDATGLTSNVFDQTTTPASFPLGVSTTQVTNKQIVSGTPTDTGILMTSRYSTVAETNTYQWFIPQYDATFLDDMYFRKAINGTTWAAWFRVTGV